MSAARARWAVRVDTGGTFTDCLATEPDGSRHRVKVLSSGRVRARALGPWAGGRLPVRLPWRLPADFFRGCRLAAGDRDEVEIEGYEPGAAEGEGVLVISPGAAPPVAGRAVEVVTDTEAPVLAARIATGTPFGRPLPPLDLRLASTRGTNALLERRGAPTALFVTRGFGDLLEIGNQQRPDLFALEVVKPAPLYAAVVEVRERLAADGSVLAPLELGGLEATVERLLETGVRAAAVALLHAWREPRHERELAAWLRRAGFDHVAASAELAPRIQIVPRAETAVVDAYLSRAVGDYLERVGRETGGAFEVLTSSGAVVRAAGFRPKDSLLSGPAGGVVGAAAAARRSGLSRLVAFDMGGTSTDVSRFDGEHEVVYETRVGDARVLAPALAIETVAAGGGSVCRFDGDRLRVGPESAGAQPGPACYGAGGPLTLTDVNLLLGRLDPERFGIPIDPPAAERAAEEVLAASRARAGAAFDREAMLAGLLEIADERMAEAIRRISVRRGYRPRGHALVAFGGAGPQHACAVAVLLDIDTVLVPADAGLLSAEGLGRARVERYAERQVLEPLDRVGGRVPRWLERLERRARAAVVEEGVDEGEIEIRWRRASLRLAGQDAALTVPCGDDATPLAESFAAAYAARYGYPPPRRAIEIESLRVAAAAKVPEEPPVPTPAPVAPPPPSSRRPAWFAGGWLDVDRYERRLLTPGTRLAGPALVLEAHSATAVAPGWRLTADGAGALLLERGGGRP